MDSDSAFHEDVPDGAEVSALDGNHTAETSTAGAENNAENSTEDVTPADAGILFIICPQNIGYCMQMLH